VIRRAVDDVVRKPVREGVPSAWCERDSAVLVLAVDGLRMLGSGVADEDAFGAGEASAGSAGADDSGRASSGSDGVIGAPVAGAVAQAGAVSDEGIAASSRNPALGSRTVCDEAEFGTTGSRLGDSMLRERATRRRGGLRQGGYRALDGEVDFDGKRRAAAVKKRPAAVAATRQRGVCGRVLQSRTAGVGRGVSLTLPSSKITAGCKIMDAILSMFVSFTRRLSASLRSLEF
jgi:hypothetical protein